MNTNQNIGVLELRNYLLKPKTSVRFQNLFNQQFVEPMIALGGDTVGQFRIEGEEDRFVWMRGFENMQTRLKFLNGFYVDSPVWKKYRSVANAMMINSDNVNLLRPVDEESKSIHRDALQNKGEIVVVDFYVCNGTLDQVIELFKTEYLPFLKSKNISEITLWESEMSENEFPQLPVFQDKNLLVAMTSYKNETEYRRKSKLIKTMTSKLDHAMKQLITTRSRSVLFPVNESLKKFV